MRVGYAAWGFLADVKIVNGNPFSSPDGNFFYSWSLINGLVDRGHEVIRLMPNRDFEAVEKHGWKAFGSFASMSRFDAYTESLPSVLSDPLDGIDVCLIEWRMPIPGRNTGDSIGSHEFQPDLMLQEYIVAECKRRGIPVIAFDLDYKMEVCDDAMVDHVIELGWKRGAESHVEIPFGFEHIHDNKLVDNVKPIVTYIGNRYERDWAVDKYLAIEPDGDLQVIVYGNWLERGRQSDGKWQHITFGPRVQPKDFLDIYSNSAVTPLLAKKEYCDHGFMTVRVIEAAFYGSLPVLMSEFKSSVKYLPADLIVDSAEEVAELALMAASNPKWRKAKIEEVREGLRFMDGVNFADRLSEITSKL